MQPDADNTTAELADDGEFEEQIDDWKLDFNFFVFSRHEQRLISSRNLRDGKMTVECVESLTPVDMVNLGSGIHDATGHCVWMGAFFLVDALPELASYIDKKRVLELGCGTGIGAIATLLSKTPPSFVSLSDGDPDALNVCRRNCVHNQLEQTQYEVRELMWGEPLQDMVFDVVLATDVLYDIGLLPPLFQTATESEARIFILSHVPRACYSTELPPVENLEDYIVMKAEEDGWKLQRCIRPGDFSEEERPKEALNDVTLEEMAQVGAAIMIFELNNN